MTNDRALHLSLFAFFASLLFAFLLFASCFFAFHFPLT